MSSKNLRMAIIVLTALTAVIHLYLGISLPNPLFLLNGIGYFVLLWAYLWTPPFLANRTGLIRSAFLGYTIVTIVAYFLINIGHLDAFGIGTKIIEVLLVLALLRHKS